MHTDFFSADIDDFKRKRGEHGASLVFEIKICYGFLRKLALVFEEVFR